MRTREQLTACLHELGLSAETVEILVGIRDEIAAVHEDETARLRAEVERFAVVRDLLVKRGDDFADGVTQLASELDSLRAKLAAAEGNAAEWMAQLAESRIQLAAAEKERDGYRDALQKVSDIRDSIVGMQGFNFSEHAYPLVAVLNAAGFKGKGYEISRASLGTLIEQRDKAEADRDRLAAELQAAREETEAVREAMRQAQETATRRLADGERMRAVYEAAIAVRHSGAMRAVNAYQRAARNELCAALDAALAAKENG